MTSVCPLAVIRRNWPDPLCPPQPSAAQWQCYNVEGHLVPASLVPAALVTATWHLVLGVHLPARSRQTPQHFSKHTNLPFLQIWWQKIRHRMTLMDTFYFLLYFTLNQFTNIHLYFDLLFYNGIDIDLLYFGIYKYKMYNKF